MRKIKPFAGANYLIKADALFSVGVYFACDALIRFQRFANGDN
jgi:hypothetical protein